MQRNIVIAFAVLTLPMAVSACNLVNSTQANQVEDFAKKCVIESHSENAKVKFIKAETTADAVSPAEKENGISQRAVMKLSYIFSPDGKTWYDSKPAEFFYRINKGKAEFWLRDRKTEKKEKREWEQWKKKKIPKSLFDGRPMAPSAKYQLLGYPGYWSSSCPESILSGDLLPPPKY